MKNFGTVLSAFSLFLLLSPLGRTQTALPSGVTKVASVEGISQYQFDNGLKLLVFPDPSKPTITVNMTYLVGSRHEGSGEGGMAHLLEHMVFKGSPKHDNIPQELTEHGARPNGSDDLGPHQLLRDLPGIGKEFALGSGFGIRPHDQFLY